jgi:hypothetical protein
MLGDYSASVMAGGHTHSQMLRRYEDQHIVNAGSVGLAGVNPSSPELAANRDVDWAEYAVLSLQNGRLSIELCRTRLNMEAVRAAPIRSGMPHVEWWMQQWARSALSALSPGKAFRSLLLLL